MILEVFLIIKYVTSLISFRCLWPLFQGAYIIGYLNLQGVHNFEFINFQSFNHEKILLSYINIFYLISFQENKEERD